MSPIAVLPNSDGQGWQISVALPDTHQGDLLVGS